MIRIILIVCLNLVFLRDGNGQNLVPNPSFEDTLNCPSGLDQLSFCSQWWSFRNSPDYFNSCTNSVLVDVPENWFGYQNANSGFSIAGFKTFFTPEYREYLGAQLTSPLVVGETYYLSFFINMAFGGGAPANCATNNIGVLFSTVSFNQINPLGINNFSHFNYNNIISDSLNCLSPLLAGHFSQ